MTPDHANILAAELASHRAWRVEGVGPAPATVLPGPAEGVWVRLSHRAQPEARYVIPVWPERAAHLTQALHDAGQQPRPGLAWYSEGEVKR